MDWGAFLVAAGLSMAVGMGLAAWLGVYLRRVRPPKDDAEGRRMLMLFCAAHAAGTACAVTAVGAASGVTAA
jgi:hypothetical protein